VTPPTFLSPPFYLEQIFLHPLASFLFLKILRENFSLIFHTEILVESRNVIRRVM
jgi:hypothetical protein